VDDFSLVSDTAYVVQNASRLLRGVFEIALRKSLVRTAYKLLELSKTVERRLWCVAHAARSPGG
jgi:activating signal cointegrator complex subunit 3